jgi:hypothetical protein
LLWEEEYSEAAQRNCSDMSISGGVAGIVDVVWVAVMVGSDFGLCTEAVLEEDWVGEGIYSSGAGDVVDEGHVVDVVGSIGRTEELPWVLTCLDAFSPPSNSSGEGVTRPNASSIAVVDGMPLDSLTGFPGNPE